MEERILNKRKETEKLNEVITYLSMYKYNISIESHPNYYTIIYKVGRASGITENYIIDTNDYESGLEIAEYLLEVLEIR